MTKKSINNLFTLYSKSVHISGSGSAPTANDRQRRATPIETAAEPIRNHQ